MSLLILSVGSNAHGADREHQIKSAFIYNFAKFIEWPGGLGDSNSNFVIGIYGASAFEDELQLALAGKSVLGHPIEIEEVRSDSAVRRCRILITGANTEERIFQLLRVCKANGTVLVGESPDFARMGGTVGFAIEAGKVRFDVNLKTAKSDDLVISSKLLSLARTVIH